MKSSSTIVLSYVLCIATLVLASAIIFFVRQLPARSLKHCQKLVDHERALLTMGFVAFAASLGLFFINYTCALLANVFSEGFMILALMTMILITIRSSF
jgi:hypothetical protein